MSSKPNSDSTRDPQSRADSSLVDSPGRGSTIGAGTTMTGRLTSRSDLHFSGHLTGEINVEGELTVAAGAGVEGPVTARAVCVAGGVCGRVRGDERVEVVRGGSVAGDLVAACVVLGEGSEHDGRIELLYSPIS